MDPQKFKNHCLKYLCPPNSILLSFLFSLCSMILFSCMISSTPMVSWNISRSQIHIFKALRLYTRLPSGCLYFEVLETAQRSKHQNETIFFPPNHYSFCIPCLNERPYYQPTWDRNPKAISDSFLFLIALPPRSLSILLSSYLSNPFSSLFPSCFLFFFLPSPAFSSTFFPFRSSSTTISKLLYLPSCPSWTHLSMKTKTSQIVLGERLRAVVFRVPMIGEGTSLQQAPPLIPFPFDIFSLSV